MRAAEAVAGSGQRWTPEDGPAIGRTDPGAVYTVDGQRRRHTGGRFDVRDALVGGAVDHPDGPIRVPEIVVGLRMGIVTSAGPVCSSIVAEIAAAPEAGERSGPWPKRP